MEGRIEGGSHPTSGMASEDLTLREVEKPGGDTSIKGFFCLNMLAILLAVREIGKFLGVWFQGPLCLCDLIGPYSCT